MQSPLRSLLNDKGHDVYTTLPTATVLQAVSEMNDRGVGALLVMEEERPIGIFTERDVLSRVVSQERDPSTTPVSEVMTREMVALRPTVTVEDAMAVVTDKRCRHLPVLEDGRVVGLVSIGDLTRWVGRDREVQIQQLVDFVTGKYPA